jgi:hypothetical protein
MPWYERRRPTFEVMPDGEGRPSRVYIDLVGPEPSLLDRKQVGRLFLALGENVQWEEAEALASQLAKMVTLFCIHHVAAGE